MRERLGFRHEDIDPELNQIVGTILSSVSEVRTILGAGLLEDAYRVALLHELYLRGVKTKTKVSLPLVYKGIVLPKRYEIDVLVEDRIILELKAVDALHGIHAAQILTYMRLARKPLGFLVNFNSIPLAEGIKRFAMTSPGQRSDGPPVGSR